MPRLKNWFLAIFIKRQKLEKLKFFYHCLKYWLLFVLLSNWNPDLPLHNFGYVQFLVIIIRFAVYATELLVKQLPWDLPHLLHVRPHHQHSGKQPFAIWLKYHWPWKVFEITSYRWNSILPRRSTIHWWLRPQRYIFFIGPESEHWQCLSLYDSLTHSLTHSCLVNLIDVTLACEDANSKLVEVVTVADVDV